jgi:hypothetical protein
MVVAIVGVLEEQGRMDQSVLHHWVPLTGLRGQKVENLTGTLT